jgi:hypothetical protein
LIVADRAAVQEECIFLLRTMPGWGVNLAAWDGRWVSADRNRDNLLVADRTSAYSWSPWSWELFQLEWHGERVALRASNKRYACAESGGGGCVRVDRVAPAAWELFTLIDLQVPQ